MSSSLGKRFFFVVPMMAAITLSATPARSESFSTELMRIGEKAYSKGEFELAEQNFRLACFGLLEEPSNLAVCRAKLALVQANRGDRSGFTATFDRIISLERRFAAYTEAVAGSNLDIELAHHAEDWLDPVRLAGIPAFVEISRRLWARQLEQKASPQDRRQFLAQMIEADPDYHHWRILAAREEVAASDFAKAAEIASAVLAAQPDFSEAKCITGLALAELGQCERAIGFLPSCTEPAPTRSFEVRLSCELQMRRWDSATELVTQIEDSERRRARRIRKEIEIGRSQDSAATFIEGESSDLSDAPSEVASAPSQIVETTPPAIEEKALGTDLSQEISEAREAVRDGSRSELEAVFFRFDELLIADPSSLDLSDIAATSAFRLGRWNDVVRILESSQVVLDDRPDLLFYLSVSLFETGDRDQAIHYLERSLPKLPRTEYVDSYVAKLFGEVGS